MSTECLIPSYTIHDIGDIETLSQIYPSHINELNIPKLWTRTKGKGVRVAVLDSGTPYKHPDLTNNVDLSKCRSFIPGEDIFDVHLGHSTHVGGIIGAENNQIGIIGIAPEVTLIGIKVLNKNGRSESDSILKGLEYCLKLNPDVINMSLGGTSPMPEVHEVIKKLVNERNIPIICSAGNNGENKILYPAQYDECIAVGSYSESTLKDRSIFSSWGESLDIMAPGEKIFSTYLNGQYAVLSGTSMATPTVTGIVALMISYYRKLGKELTIKELKDLLFSNCIDIGAGGRDIEHGWGMINPEQIFARMTGEKILPLTLWQKIKRFFSK